MSPRCYYTTEHVLPHKSPLLIPEFIRNSIDTCKILNPNYQLQSFICENGFFLDFSNTVAKKIVSIDNVTLHRPNFNCKEDQSEFAFHCGLVSTYSLHTNS